MPGEVYAPGRPVADRTVRRVVEDYITAGHPIVKKGKLAKKAPKTVENERKALKPILVRLGDKPASKLSLATCDEYRAWRNSGGWVIERQKVGEDEPDKVITKA